MARTSLTPEALLAQLPTPIADLAASLRSLIRESLPEAREVAYAGWRAIGYRHPEAGYVGGVFLFEDHVRVIFEHGHLLPDPDRLLQGETRQTRHMPFAPGDAVPTESLARLFDAAVAVGRELRSDRRPRRDDPPSPRRRAPRPAQRPRRP